MAQRAKVHDLLAPRPGERILNIGAGPGLLAHDLARLVRTEGRGVGLDNTPAMIAMAKTRLAALPQAECMASDATGLAFADRDFDAAVSAQVYEYLADVPRAGFSCCASKIVPMLSQGYQPVVCAAAAGIIKTISDSCMQTAPATASTKRRSKRAMTIS